MAQDGIELASQIHDHDLSGSHHTPTRKFQLADLEGTNSKLASLPDIFIQINEALNNPKSSAAFIADIISKDTSLSAKLLRLVNSAFYGLPKQIDSLSRAVTILGSQELLTLAVGVSVIKLFKDIPADFIDMESFCKHSIVCGILAGLIAAQVNRNLSEERFFVGGLLHDIGRLFMLTNYSQMAQETLIVSRQQKAELVPIESEVWGFNHATIAGELFRIWKFPATLETPIRYHHNPLASQPPLEPGIIHIADIMAHSLDMGESGNWYVPALEPEIWEMTGLAENIIPFLAKRTDQKIANIMRVFF
jgi:HD-like signal output (HDOD) protein